MVVTHPVSLYLSHYRFLFYLASTGVSVFEVLEQTTCKSFKCHTQKKSEKLKRKHKKSQGSNKIQTFATYRELFKC